MFHSISWQSYWTAIAIVSLIYYLIVYVYYFRRSIGMKTSALAAFHSGFNGTPATEATHEAAFRQEVPSRLDEETTTEFSLPEENSKERVVYSCMDEIKAFMEQAKKVHWVKDELLFALTSILKKYPSIKDSTYRQSVTNVLKTECEHHCSLYLSAEEMAQVWTGV